MDHLGYVLHVHFIQRKQIYFFRAACMMEKKYIFEVQWTTKIEQDYHWGIVTSQ